METLIVYFCKYTIFAILSLLMILYYLRHVQVNNEGAIDFYKKFGFEIVETKEHYYKRIEPADAHVLQKTIRKSGQANGTLE